MGQRRRAAVESELDAEVIAEAIDQVRSVLRKIKTIEAKARAITKSAEDIRSLVSFQLRRVNVALDEAEKGFSRDVYLAQPA